MISSLVTLPGEIYMDKGAAPTMATDAIVTAEFLFIELNDDPDISNFGLMIRDRITVRSGMVHNEMGNNEGVSGVTFDSNSLPESFITPLLNIPFRLGSCSNKCRKITLASTVIQVSNQFNTWTGSINNDWHTDGNLK